MESFRAALGTSCASAIAVINAAGELVLWELLHASYFSVVVKVHDLHCKLSVKVDYSSLGPATRCSVRHSLTLT